MNRLVPDIDAAAAAIVDEHIKTLIERIERAVDDHPRLTRKHPRIDHLAPAELVFSRDGWEARVDIRSRAARGRGSRHLVTARTRESHSSPSEAASELIASFELWDKVLASS